GPRVRFCPTADIDDRGLPMAKHECAWLSSRRWAAQRLARLERLDGYLAEFDRASSVLQDDRPLVEHAIAQFGGLFAVEHDGDVPSVDRDLVRVPLLACLRHGINLNIASNGTGAVAWVRPFVENVSLIAGAVGDHFRIEATEINSAIGVVAR